MYKEKTSREKQIIETENFIVEKYCRYGRNNVAGLPKLKSFELLQKISFFNIYKVQKIVNQLFVPIHFFYYFKMEYAC